MHTRRLSDIDGEFACGLTSVSTEHSSKKLPPRKITVNKSCPALNAYVAGLCTIPSGSFVMGDRAHLDESPLHTVRLSKFQMGKTPVTVGMWEEYVRITGRSMPEDPVSPFAGGNQINKWWSMKRHPIVYITWDQCQQYAAWASQMCGIVMTLPTEAQWEYACRGGMKQTTYPWGNTFNPAKVWCSKSKQGDRMTTGAVDRTSNIMLDHPWRLVDMVGNVWEWCVDWYDPSWYRSQQATVTDSVNVSSSPKQKITFVDGSSDKGALRVIRGGSWSDIDKGFFRSACRMRDFPDNFSHNYGFRLVVCEIN
jgi:formylglycine-generating enzyme required for sulfatase activity